MRGNSDQRHAQDRSNAGNGQRDAFRQRQQQDRSPVHPCARVFECVTQRHILARAALPVQLLDERNEAYFAYVEWRLSFQFFDLFLSIVEQIFIARYHPTHSFPVGTGNTRRDLFFACIIRHGVLFSHTVNIPLFANSILHQVGVLQYLEKKNSHRRSQGGDRKPNPRRSAPTTAFADSRRWPNAMQDKANIRCKAAQKRLSGRLLCGTFRAAARAA